REFGDNSLAGGRSTVGCEPGWRGAGQARSLHAHAHRAPPAFEIIIAAAARRKRTSEQRYSSRAENPSVKIKFRKISPALGGGGLFFFGARVRLVGRDHFFGD